MISPIPAKMVMPVMRREAGQLHQIHHRACPGLFNRQASQFRIHLPDQLAEVLHQKPLLLEAEPLERRQRQRLPLCLVFWRREVVTVEHAVDPIRGPSAVPH